MAIPNLLQKDSLLGCKIDVCRISCIFGGDLCLIWCICIKLEHRSLGANIVFISWVRQLVEHHCVEDSSQVV